MAKMVFTDHLNGALTTDNFIRPMSFLILPEEIINISIQITFKYWQLNININLNICSAIALMRH
jgi:hypothetical protein